MPIEKGCTHCGSDQHNTTDCPMRDAAPAGERETIRAVFLRNGFTVNEGQTDLKPYVYAAAEELLSIARTAWQRTQSAGVPDALREAVEYLDDNPFNEIGAGSILHRVMRDALAAAPTVKAEQVRCQECGGNGAGGDHEDDCSKAPSLPSAGSPALTYLRCACGDEYPANSYGAGFMAANNGVCENCDAANSCASEPAAAAGSAVEEVEVVGWRIGFPNGAGYKLYEQHQPWAHEEYGPVSYEVQDLMTIAQHERILASWQRAQSAPAGAVPGGWRLVPVEPTPEMLQAGADEPLAGDHDDDAPEDYRAVFKAMLAAAPQPAPQHGDKVCQHIEEAAGILRNMIDSIATRGNYSQESTLLFLNQALGSIDAAISAQGEGART